MECARFLAMPAPRALANRHRRFTDLDPADLALLTTGATGLFDLFDFDQVNR